MLRGDRGPGELLNSTTKNSEYTASGKITTTVITHVALWTMQKDWGDFCGSVIGGIFFFF